MRSVIDTNVLVSALWNPHGPPARIIDAVYSGTLDPVLSDPMLDEYVRVLTRPELGLPTSLVRDMLGFFRRFLLPLPPPCAALRCSDPGDQKFLDAALAGQADILVTGNRRHFPPHVPRLAILAPAAALDRIHHQQ